MTTLCSKSADAWVRVSTETIVIFTTRLALYSIIIIQDITRPTDLDLFLKKAGFKKKKILTQQTSLVNN